MATHAYWRLLIYQNNGWPSALKVYEMQMYDGSGNLLSTGGTASASDTTGGAASNAFDTNLGTFWGINTFASGTLPTLTVPAWLKYTFALPVNVGVVRLYCSDGPTAPNLFKLQWSDDNSTWNDASGLITPMEWAGDAVCWSLTSNTTTIPGGSFANWRVLTTRRGGAYIGCAEFVMRETAGGATAFGSNAYAIAGADMTANHGPLTNAFDGNLSSYVQSGASGTEWIGYAFQKPVRIVEVDWTVPASFASINVDTLTLQGSNDCGQTWFAVANFTAAAWTAPNQAQIFGVALDQRGNIAYNQVRVLHRNGAGGQFQMFGGGSASIGNAAMFDNFANVIDAGGLAVTRTTAIPPASSSAGSPGQIAIDGSGNLYVCYAANAWKKFAGSSF